MQLQVWVEGVREGIECMYTYVCKSGDTASYTDVVERNALHRTLTCTYQYAQTLNIDQYGCNGSSVRVGCIVVMMVVLVVVVVVVMMVVLFAKVVMGYDGSNGYSGRESPYDEV